MKCSFNRLLPDMKRRKNVRERALIFGYLTTIYILSIIYLELTIICWVFLITCKYYIWWDAMFRATHKHTLTHSLTQRIQYNIQRPLYSGYFNRRHCEEQTHTHAHTQSQCGTYNLTKYSIFINQHHNNVLLVPDDCAHTDIQPQ